MQVSALVRNTPDSHQVEVRTNDAARRLPIADTVRAAHPVVLETARA